jgi:hypothetical protein
MIELLVNIKLPRWHVRRTRLISIETFKIINGIAPPVLDNILQKRDSRYNFRYSNILQVPQVRTTSYIPLFTTIHTNIHHIDAFSLYLKEKLQRNHNAKYKINSGISAGTTFTQISVVVTSYENVSDCIFFKWKIHNRPKEVTSALYSVLGLYHRKQFLLFFFFFLSSAKSLSDTFLGDYWTELNETSQEC